MIIMELDDLLNIYGFLSKINVIVFNEMPCQAINKWSVNTTIVVSCVINKPKH